MDITATLPEPRAFPRDPPPAADDRGRTGLARASLLDTLGLLFDVVLPTIAKGVIVRRPAVLAVAERLDLDRRAVRRVQRLRERYGTGPLLLRAPDRPRALILDPRDVHRVLEQSPQPFSPASSEKRAALRHLEPQGVLISEGTDRTVRRQLNEAALRSGEPVHPLADRFAAVVREEATALLASASRWRLLTWDDFAPAWFRVVRRVVLGDAARHDHGVTDTLARLRADANWAFLRPRQDGVREQWLGHVRGYLAKADAGSLAGALAGLQPSARAAPEHQVSQWLFAFDPAGMATFRALALLTAHPGHARQALQQAGGGDAHHHPLLRAAVLESLRLWPTTPLLLRETRTETEWSGGVLPAGTGLMIYVPFFHRDGQTQGWADRFEPGLWLQPRTTADWPLVPFSSGPAVCPARHLVLMLASAMLGQLLQAGPYTLEHPRWLRADRPLPCTLSHAAIRLRMDGRDAA